MLNLTPEISFTVDYYDLGQTINEHYGIQAEVLDFFYEPNNDTVHSYTRYPANDETSSAKVANWVALVKGSGGTDDFYREMPTINQVMDDLISRSVLPEGNYNIRISW